MSSESQRRVQVEWESMGTQACEFSEKVHINEVRGYFMENSPLGLYENFHFNLQGKSLNNVQELHELPETHLPLTVAMEPFDLYSAQHHVYKVKQILAQPIQWAMLNSRDFNTKPPSPATQPTPQLQDLFQHPFSSPFLDLAPPTHPDFSSMVSLSGFNPPPPHRKLQGDLLYLHVKTLEETQLHITSSTEGFFVNCSTQGNFNPHANSKYSPAISLLDLLQQVSPQFKGQFSEVQRQGKVSEAQRINYNQRQQLEHWNWLRDKETWKRAHSWSNDCSRDSHRSELAVVKEWMQLLHTYRVGGSQSLSEQANRYKIRWKLRQEMVECAKQGVRGIFNGTIQPLKRKQHLEQQVYMYCYLIMYFAGEKGSVSSSQANRDLINVGIIEELDSQSVNISHPIIVHYRGYKVVVRTIPNSFLSQPIPHSYSALLQHHNQLPDNPVLAAMLRKICKHLSLQTDTPTISTQAGKTQFIGHPSVRGCMSQDDKPVLINLGKLAPKDPNFSQSCYIRAQMMRLFNNKQKCTILYNPLISQIPLPNLERTKQQERKLTSVGKFAKQVMVGVLVDSFDGQMRKYLSDSRGIIYALHKHGLSSQYLGGVVRCAKQKKANHVAVLVERVIAVKSFKRLVKKALRQGSMGQHKTIVKHLLNCLFMQTEEEHDNGNAKRSKKKKSKETETFFEMTLPKDHDSFLTMNSSVFWQNLCSIGQQKFNHTLPARDQLFNYSMSRNAILRDVCLCLGIQIQRRQFFESPFVEQDILQIVPRIKIPTNDPESLDQMIEQGDRMAAKYQLQEAFEMYNKALQWVFSCYNGVHQKLGLINKRIATLYFAIGDPQTALLFALNSCDSYEALVGQEHPQTLQAYLMVSLYHLTIKKTSQAQWYLLKAIFLAKWAYSECYPQLLLMYLSLSTVYETQKKYPQAIMTLVTALQSCRKVYGENHAHSAVMLAALASLHSQIPDIAQAIKYQQQAVDTLSLSLGAEDERVLEAKQVHQSYKSIQAGRKVRENHEKEQKNGGGMGLVGRFNLKMPLMDFKQRSGDIFWKRSRKMKYFY